MVYAREVNGEELTFGVSGLLLRDALVMFDHQTDSLWSQFIGKARAFQGSHGIDLSYSTIVGESAESDA